MGGSHTASHRKPQETVSARPAGTDITAQQAPLCDKVKDSESGPGERSGGWEEGRLSSQTEGPC